MKKVFLESLNRILSDNATSKNKVLLIVDLKEEFDISFLQKFKKEGDVLIVGAIFQPGVGLIFDADSEIYESSPSVDYILPILAEESDVRVIAELRPNLVIYPAVKEKHAQEVYFQVKGYGIKVKTV